MNVNIHDYNLGFVSDESVENFIFEATLFSNHESRKDNDDVIGLVIAFHRENEKNYAISVGKTFNGIEPMGDNGTFGVFYGEIAYIFPWNGVLQQILLCFLLNTNYSEQEIIGSQDIVRIKVQRNGDDITVKMNGENDSRESAKHGAFIEDHTININLNDDPKLEKFKGPMQYGYIVKSQA